MQIILASAKIMHDRLKAVPDASLSEPRFQNEAIGFARDMAQYPSETIADMLGCSGQIAAQNKLRFMRFFEMQAVWAKTCRGAMTRFIIENRITNPDELSAFSYEGFEYEPTLGESDYPHFIK